MAPPENRGRVGVVGRYADRPVNDAAEPSNELNDDQGDAGPSQPDAPAMSEPAGAAPGDPAVAPDVSEPAVAPEAFVAQEASVAQDMPEAPATRAAAGAPPAPPAPPVPGTSGKPAGSGPKRPQTAPPPAHIVEVEVTRVDGAEVEVRLADGRTGVVDRRDFPTPPSVGESVPAAVLSRADDRRGRVALSHRWARTELAWQRVEKARAEHTPLTGKVVKQVKGGVVVDLGLRAFLPTSLIGDIEIEAPAPAPTAAATTPSATPADPTSAASTAPAAEPVGTGAVDDASAEIAEPVDAAPADAVPFDESSADTAEEVEEVEAQSDAIAEAHVSPAEVAQADPAPSEVAVTEVAVTDVAVADAASVEGATDELAVAPAAPAAPAVEPAKAVTVQVADPSALVGREIEVLVTEADRTKDRLVVSRRDLQRKQRRKAEKDRLGSFTVGSRVTGKVVSVADYGAVIDLGGVRGLVHRSELTWGRLGQPSDVVSVGEQVTVEVLDVNRSKKRVSLSLKRTSPDPYGGIEAGQIVPATITRVVDYGAFARLESGAEGLIHMSELSDVPGYRPDQLVIPGEEVMVKVMNVDTSKHRIGLSVRRVLVDD